MANWTDMAWLCIDSETTGIDPASARIVELAAVQFQQGKPCRRMGMLINPGTPIPDDATAIHGIRDEDVASCPRIDEVSERFLRHVRAAEVLVGYNWPFDSAMLEASLGQAWLDAIAGKPILDVLVVVRLEEVGRFWKGPGRHRLDAVAERLGISREGQAHRASSDCVLTCRILWHLREHLPADADAAAARVAEEGLRQEHDYQKWRSSVG